MSAPEMLSDMTDDQLMQEWESRLHNYQFERGPYGKSKYEQDAAMQLEEIELERDRRFRAKAAEKHTVWRQFVEGGFPAIAHAAKALDELRVMKLILADLCKDPAVLARFYEVLTDAYACPDCSEERDTMLWDIRSFIEVEANPSLLVREMEEERSLELKADMEEQQ